MPLKDRAKYLEYLRKYKKIYREKNLKRLKEESNQWNKENPEKHRQSQKKYFDNHKEKEWERGRRIKLKRDYNLTLEQYNQMFVDQNGVCDICKENPSKGKQLCVDHDHNTGKVRGLLCNNCNFGIGFLKDSINNLSEAIKYLSK